MMDKNKVLSIFSIIIAVLLSDVASARAAIEYCNLIKVESSHDAVIGAILAALPYFIMMLFPLLNSLISWKKSGKQRD